MSNIEVTLGNALFGFKIDSIDKLHNMLMDTCEIRTGSRLIKFENDDGTIVIDYLDPYCNRQRIQFEEEMFVDARIGGRNRHGKRVAYVHEAEVLVITIDLKDIEEGMDSSPFFEAIIDDDKIFNITKYIRM